MNRYGRNLSCQNLERVVRILGKDTLLVGARFVLFFMVNDPKTQISYITTPMSNYFLGQMGLLPV